MDDEIRGAQYAEGIVREREWPQAGKAQHGFRDDRRIIEVEQSRHDQQRQQRKDNDQIRQLLQALNRLRAPGSAY